MLFIITTTHIKKQVLSMQVERCLFVFLSLLGVTVVEIEIGYFIT